MIHDGSVVKESACNARDIGNAVLILGSGRTPEGKWQPTPVFLPEKFHGQRSLVGHSPKGLKETTEQLCINTTEAFKETGRIWRREWQPTPVFLAWRNPWTEEPGELQSIGLQRVRHNWASNKHKKTEKIWVQVWGPGRSPCEGESHGWKQAGGCSDRILKELCSPCALFFVCLNFTNNSEVTVESCIYKLINRSSETIRNLPWVTQLLNDTGGI